MDTTEKDIRNLFANSGQLDRDEVAMLLLQLVERIQNLERAPQRTWVGLTDEEIRKAKHHMVDGAYDYSFKQGAKWAEAKLKEKNA